MGWGLRRAGKRLTGPMCGSRMVPFWNRLRDMPNLSIKNVPEPVVERLRTRARCNHRSLQGELLALLTESVRTEAGVADASEDASGPGRASIEEIAAEHRTRWPEPQVQGPASSEIIRAERDAR